MPSLLIINGSASPDNQAIEEQSRALATDLGLSLEYRHAANHSAMLQHLQEGSEAFDSLIICPIDQHPESEDAYHAAIQRWSTLGKPLIEVHAANIFAQENNGKHPLKIAGANTALVCGMGAGSYRLAILAIARQLHEAQQASED